MTLSRIAAVPLGALLCALLLAVLVPGLALAEPRVALIIANGKYGGDMGSLKNPVNDGALLARALKSVGFTVTLVTDGDQRAMKQAITDFGQALSDAGPTATGLFYYAGHGVQVGGENYLVPVGAAIKREGDVDLEAVSADAVLRELDFAGSRVRIVILDACRNNPIERSARAATMGLAKVDAPIGSFIAYSTAPGSVAADGKGDNSPFATALAADLQRPGAAIEETFRNVRAKVVAETDSQQVPWDSSSLTAPFYFTTPSDATAAAAAAPAGSAAETAGANDGLFWGSIKDSRDPADFSAYLKKFPDGTFADLARNRLAELSSKAAAGGATQLASLSPPDPGGVVRSAAPDPGSRRPGTVFRDCKDCPEMVVIPAGTFTMGSPDSEIGHAKSESPQHQVTIAKPLAFSRTVVTVAEFREFVKATGRDRGGACWYYKDETDEWIERKGKYFDDPGYAQTDQSPAVCVDFADGQAFADWLTQKTGAKYRLPSEAEWEYAARAGSKGARFWGNALDLQCSFANGADESYHNAYPQDPGWNHFCDDGFVKTSPVGSFKPNRFGLYDMLGNTWQMTEDCFHEDYATAPGDGSPVLGTCEKQVIRGGSWGRGPQFLRSAMRGRIAPDIRSVGDSIRLVREM